MPGSTTKLDLPYPLPDDDVEVEVDIQELAEAIDDLGVVPPGGIIMWPATLPPTGWLMLVGQEDVSSASNPGLTALFGQTGGFVNMPDMSGRFVIGSNDLSRPLLTAGGEATHTLTDAERGMFASAPGPGENGMDTGTMLKMIPPTAHNNIPPYLALNFIVRAG